MTTRTSPGIGRLGGPHPVVRGRRIHDLLLTAASLLLPLALGLAITLSSPRPNPLLILGLMIGAALVVVLLVSRRYEVTLMLLALYLGLLDGPIKLESASKASSGVRDVLIIAIALGMIMRLVVRKGRVRLPPLSAWVIAFVAFVLIEALNPQTHGILKVIGGWRQLLEWVPFFYFGYIVVRSKQRFRQLFMLLGVIALLNGVVGAIQTHISPGSLAAWGPGYSGLVHGGQQGTGLTGRTFKSNGVTHARPPALGSDSGFGGGVGVLALPGLLALLAAGKVRRRWLIVLFALGAVLGIATAASRTSVVSAVIVLLSFGGLSLLAGIRVGRAFTVLVVIVALAFAVVTVLTGVEGSGIFARQETLTSSSELQQHGAGAKERSLSQIPSDVVRAPLGVGLGTAGSVGGFGGAQKVELEGEKVIGGSAYSLLWKESGAPGLLIWLGLTLNVILLGAARLRKVKDVELRTYLLGAIVAFIALTIQGLSGPTLAVTTGAFLWFVPGVISYWLAGDGREEAFRTATPNDPPAALLQPAAAGAL
jgi:hypothetical protein